LEDGLSERPPHPPVARASVAAEFDITDDPFGAPTSNRDTGRQLPRFPSEPAAAGSLPPAARTEVFEEIEAISAIDGVAAPNAAAASAGEGLEDLLDEADFFTTRGLYDDAKAILVEQLTRTPHHPLVLERLREVESAVGASGESRTIERSQLGRSQPAEAAFDVGASLGALDDMDEKPVGAPGTRALPGREVDVDQVFEKFKAGIRAQVSETDSSTHYDLGVAYKEMGLIAEAVHEFELSARDPARECMCFAMIGMIHLEQNQLDRAAESYMQALNAPSKTPEQEMNLFYDLGNVHEMKGNEQDALFYFQKVSLRDPDYRDVADRLASLTRTEGAAPVASSARAVNDKDDFDGVFDDMFENKG
jgi:tetratricopeptide (TPR) repeat protein